MKNKLALLLIRLAFKLMKGGDTMVAIYVTLIHKGVIKIEDVPTWGGNRDKVIAALEAAGLDETGAIV